MLDKINSGFITREGWHSNIDHIISFSDHEKESLFQFMDKNHSQMIDYKSFLSHMNGNPNINCSEQFDWA
jgi:Ca2+-binding EF-hand superfamily protein